MSHTWLRERGSSPVVGSSRNSSCGVTMMLLARITDMVFLVLVIAVAVVVWLFVALFSWQFARLLAITEVDVFVVMPDQPALEHPSRGGRSRYLP